MISLGAEFEPTYMEQEENFLGAQFKTGRQLFFLSQKICLFDILQKFVMSNCRVIATHVAK